MTDFTSHQHRQTCSHIDGIKHSINAQHNDVSKEAASTPPPPRQPRALTPPRAPQAATPPPPAGLMPVAVRAGWSSPASANATRFSRPPFRQPWRVGRQSIHRGINGRCMPIVTVVEDGVQQPAQIRPKPDQRSLSCALQRPLRRKMVAKTRPAISWKAGVSKGVIHDRDNARNFGEPRQVVVR